MDDKMALFILHFLVKLAAMSVPDTKRLCTMILDDINRNRQMQESLKIQEPPNLAHVVQPEKVPEQQAVYPIAHTDFVLSYSCKYATCLFSTYAWEELLEHQVGHGHYVCYLCGNLLLSDLGQPQTINELSFVYDNHICIHNQ